MLVRRTTVFPVECVMRGYVSGSAWKEYQAGLPVGGERLPPGLRESDRLEPAAVHARDQGGTRPRRKHQHDADGGASSAPA